MMPRCLRDALSVAALLGAELLPWGVAHSQERVLHVMGDDGQPVAFANVTFTGERPRITNEKGEIPVSAARGARDTLMVDVRRLGYEPWYGRLALADTAVNAQVTLHRISRRMFTVTVTDSSYGVPAYLRGFYERMLARQRGIGTGVYLTPEEVDRRNATQTTALLQGVNGVALQRSATGKIIAMSSGGSCQMTVLIDGHRVCPPGGCDAGSSSSSIFVATGGERSVAARSSRRAADVSSRRSIRSCSTTCSARTRSPRSRCIHVAPRSRLRCPRCRTPHAD